MKWGRTYIMHEHCKVSCILMWTHPISEIQYSVVLNPSILLLETTVSNFSWHIFPFCTKHRFNILPYCGNHHVFYAQACNVHYLWPDFPCRLMAATSTNSSSVSTWSCVLLCQSYQSYPRFKRVNYTGYYCIYNKILIWNW